MSETWYMLRNKRGGEFKTMSKQRAKWKRLFGWKIVHSYNVSIKKKR